MAELTKEWLKQTIAEYEANRDELPFGLDTNSAIELQAFKLALASLEAEPMAVNDDMAYAFHHALSDSSLGADEVEEIKTGLRAAFANVTTQPAPVVPDDWQLVPKKITLEMECALSKADSYEIGWLWALAAAPKYEVQNAKRVQNALNSCRAAMLHGAEPVNQTYKSPQTQFKQVADLYEMQFDDGRTCTFHTDAQKAVQWLQACDGNRVQEYVKLERLQNALAGNYPVTPDGWISCSERMPKETGDIIVVSDGIVMSGISYSRRDGFYIAALEYDDDEPIGGVTHWMPLPEPPRLKEL
ncbi:DUF551 domain-containing protein [Escherichia coli]|uniref:DUF551 domain-containing protein n=1 Tax=Escherichia sp. L614-1 TaxID=2994674 RepID=UPI002FC7EFEF